jgi:hypothetical protein
MVKYTWDPCFHDNLSEGSGTFIRGSAHTSGCTLATSSCEPGGPWLGDVSGQPDAGSKQSEAGSAEVTGMILESQLQGGDRRNVAEATLGKQGLEEESVVTRENGGRKKRGPDIRGRGHKG